MDLVHRRALEPDRGDVLTMAKGRSELPDSARAFIAMHVGREPGDATLWLEALTHGSTGHERNYERLEFLGDRVLGLSIAEWLFSASGEAEGKLSQRLNALVSRAQQNVVVVEAIKLLEGDLAQAVDEIWVVDASPETQYKRLVERRKMSEAEAHQRITAQNAQSDILAVTDH